METSIDRLPYLIDQIKIAHSGLVELRDILDDILGRTAKQKIGAAPDNTQQLTKQERKILQLIQKGKSNKDVANALQVSKRTVEAHRYNIQRKLGLTREEFKKLASQKTNNLP